MISFLTKQPPSLQNSYYRVLSASYKSKINPAFAWVYDHTDICHHGGKYLNSVLSLESAIKSTSILMSISQEYR